MSFAIAGAVLVGAGAAAVVEQATKTPKIPAPPAPTPLPQASKAPDANSTLKAMGGTGQAGGSPGVAQTFLSGPGGVDQNSLLLGRATLLGG